jgi:hypothetical protein
MDKTGLVLVKHVVQRGVIYVPVLHCFLHRSQARGHAGAHVADYRRGDREPRGHSYDPVTGDKSSALPCHGGVVGTPQYVSPDHG